MPNQNPFKIQISFSRNLALTPNDVNPWGLLPWVAVVSAIGILMIAVATYLSRFELTGAMPLFWLGLVVIYAPIILRLFSSHPSRQERIGLILLLGLSLYSIYWLRSPLGITFYDEFIHWRTTNDILHSEALFSPNLLLLASAYYPGLEILISAVASLTGLSIFSSGLIIIVLSRIVLMLSLYFFFERVLGSERMAGIATAIYVANPNFLYFDSQFSYETLALPLMVFVLCLEIWRKSFGKTSDNYVFIGIILLGIVSVVVTHHITSFILLIIFMIWVILTWLVPILQKVLYIKNYFINPEGDTSLQYGGSFAITVFILAIIAIWVFNVALIVIDYLVPTMVDVLGELSGFLTGQAETRELFTSTSGVQQPLIERIAGLLASGLTVIIIPLGLWHIKNKFLTNILMLTLAAISLGYVMSFPFRFTTIGADISGRIWAFVFIGVAAVNTLGFAYIINFYDKKISHVFFTIWITVTFLGMVVVGWPTIERLPGPYAVSSMGRSIDAQSIAVTLWARDFLVEDDYMTADRMNGLLLGSIGEQNILMRPAVDIDLAQVYFSDSFSYYEREVIIQSGVRYFVVEERLSTSFPVLATYFEANELNGNSRTAPISIEVLRKFNDAPWIRRIFDGGNIIIYDVNGVPAND